MAGLSLPAGYKVDQRSFKVFHEGETKLTFTDDPMLGVNLFIVSILSYEPCTDNDFTYKIDLQTGDVRAHGEGLGWRRLLLHRWDDHPAPVGRQRVTRGAGAGQRGAPGAASA